MGDSFQRHQRPRGVVRTLRPVHTGGRDALEKRRWASFFSTAKGATPYLIIWALVILPDVNGLFSDDTLGWKIWDTLCQFRNAAYCACALWLPRTYGVRLALCVTGGWHLGQAADEWWLGDTFHAGLWEYGWLAALFIITTIIVHDYQAKGQPRS